MKQVEMVGRSWRNRLPLPLLSCELLMFMKEHPLPKKLCKLLVWTLLRVCIFSYDWIFFSFLQDADAFCCYRQWYGKSFAVNNPAPFHSINSTILEWFEAQSFTKDDRGWGQFDHSPVAFQKMCFSEKQWDPGF